MSNGQDSVLNWSSSSVPNKDCKRNAEFLLTNASVNTCTLQDGAHSLGAKARPLTHWQITLRSAQGKHSISQPVTNHTQFCSGKHTVSIRQITTYSAQGKHSVSQPMTNHTMIRLSFQSFLIFHVLFWGCPFCYWCWWPHLCTCLFFNSASKQHSIHGYNGGCSFFKLWLTCARLFLQVCRSKV